MLRKILIGFLSLGIIVLAYIIFAPDFDLIKSDFEKENSVSEITYTKQETTEIFRTIIENRDIQPDSLINKKLVPYIYYKQEDVEDDFESPPPPPSLNGWHTNAENLIRFFNSDDFLQENDSVERKFFSKQNDLEYLKIQIDSSKKISNRINLEDLISEYKSNRTKREGYYFYTPLFNNEKTEVYIQYDFYEGVYGNGFGVLLIKEKNTWKIIRIAGLWIS